MRGYGVYQPGQIIELPKPQQHSLTSIEEAFLERRSHRVFTDTPASFDNISQLLWAAYGKTPETDGMFRGDTVPSAGGIYPLNIYLIAGKITDLESGVYKYDRETHELNAIVSGDARTGLARACLDQNYTAEAPASIVVTCTCSRVRARYGSRGLRYGYMETGHVVQNVYLQAASLGMGTVSVGEFDDAAVREIIGAPADELTMAVLPVGNI